MNITLHGKKDFAEVMKSFFFETVFPEMLQISEANRRVTVKENCHSGLLFDRSSYVEAAAASIRAVKSLEMGVLACISQAGPI